MQEAQNKEISIPDLSYETILIILSYIYTGNIEFSEQNVVEVFMVRNIYF